MLVLTRKSQEKIRIGEHVTITIVRIQGNTVRVGIEAPQHVRVIRGEIAAVAASSEVPAGSDQATISLQTTTELGSAEDAEQVSPGRGIAGRVSARPRGRRDARPVTARLSMI